MWNTIFFDPVLNLTLVLYRALGNNLGWAIIGVAVIFRLLLLPLVKKQTNMTRKMAALRPQLDALQKKYANDKEKLSQEQVKLYKKSGYNPFGCLFTTIPQFLLVIVLLQVVRTLGTGSIDTARVYNFIEPWFAVGDGKITIDLMFFGLNLDKIYWIDFQNKLSVEALPYLLLVLLTGITQFFSTKFTQIMQNPQKALKKKEKKKKKEGKELSPEDLQENMGKSTAYMMPLLTIFFAVRMPAFITLFWIAQSLMLVVQYVLLDWDKSKAGIQNLISAIKNRKQLEEKVEKKK